MEAEKQLSGKKVYHKVSNCENILSKLGEMSNKMFSSLKKRGYIIEKQLKYFLWIQKRHKLWSTLFPSQNSYKVA